MRPIALHPILNFGSNDSEEVLAFLHQPDAAQASAPISARLPLSPGAPCLPELRAGLLMALAPLPERF